MSLEKLERLAEAVKSRFAGLEAELFTGFGEKHLGAAVTVHVDPDNLLAVLTILRDDPGFNFHQMIDLAGVHYPERAKPLEVVYHLLSMRHNHRIRIKVALDEGQPIPSIIGVWSCADWYEREAFDLFGILFTGHPDLRRLLNDYDFEGHPLRKDFPLSGNYELRYSEEQGRIIREPTQLQRESREYYNARDER
ncbi:MAG: NADH-quinone oxidoreductase subunit C [Magnetococcales bacterium]|nr:NADH-quinone oxidoreductase subunit C [Magnetococcales bacterium]